MAKIDWQEKFARFGVLGFCTPSTSYGGLGLNVMADVYQNPQTPIPTASSSLVTNSGSGVLDTSGNVSAPAPQVVPMDGTGEGVANDPEYGPLTIQYRRAKGAGQRPLDPYRYRQAATGRDAPEWGDAFDLPIQLKTVGGGGIMDWVKAHPGLSALGILGALALASQGKGRR